MTTSSLLTDAQMMITNEAEAIQTLSNTLDLVEGSHFEVGTRDAEMVVRWYDGDHEVAAIEWSDVHLSKAMVGLARLVYVTYA